MLRRIFGCFAASLMLSLGLLSASPARAEGSYVPAGSYLNSCKDVSFDPATNVLTADCERSRSGSLFEGEKLRTQPFNITGCAENSIWNDNNMLYCLTSKPWGQEHVIPNGSYIQTCSDRRVINNVLIAQCGDGHGNSRSATLDLNSCKWGGDISNDHGALRCEPVIAGVAKQLVPPESAPLVKPVAVEPLVKPVTIAPIEPADSSESDKNEGSAKKKRRGKRGERG